MESQLERISPVECRVRVEVAWPDVSQRLDAKLRDLRRKVRLPGFRKGKVPTNVVERLYGKGVRDEVGSDLVKETFRPAVSQHNTVPLTDPVLESSQLENGKPFTYAARFEVTPLIELQKYTGLRVRRRPAVADPERVESQLRAKQEELAEIRPLPDDLERTETAAGDVWTVDVEGSFGEQRISRKDVEVEIGVTEGGFVPGLAEQLSELSLSEVGDAKQVEYLPPQESLRPDLRGQQISLSLGLRQVRQKIRPELDDEFARDTGDAETLAELKKKIEDRILDDDKADAEREARHRLVEELLSLNPFEPAPSMISREVAGQVERFKTQLRQQGLTLSALRMSEAQVAENVRSQAVFNVMGFLLLDAIGKKEGIVATEEEVSEELAELAKERNANVARLRASMEKSQELLLLRAQIRESKILDHLMENSDVYEEPDPAAEDGEGAGSERVLGQAETDDPEGDADAEADGEPAGA